MHKRTSPLLNTSSLPYIYKAHIYLEIVLAFAGFASTMNLSSSLRQYLSCLSDLLHDFSSVTSFAFQSIYINLQSISFSSSPSPSPPPLYCSSTCFCLKAGLPSLSLSLSAHISPVSKVELRPPILTPIERKDLIPLHHWHHVSQWYVPTFNCLQIACSYSLFLVYGPSKPIPLTIPFAHEGLANFPSHCKIPTLPIST